MKKVLLSLLIFLVLAPSLVFAQNEKKKALYFYSENCSLCEEVDAYFSSQKFYDKYDIEKIEVAGPYNMTYLDEFFDVFGVDENKRGWPVVVFGEEILIGSQSIVEKFSQEMEEFGSTEKPVPSEIKKKLEQREASKNNEAEAKATASLAIILRAAFIDSVSPCSLAVIVILFAILLFVRRDRDVFLIGSFFTFGVFLTYLLIGFNSIYLIQKILVIYRYISILMGAIAILIGIFNIRYLFNLGILPPNILPYSLSREINIILRRATSPLGSLILGFLANLFLIPCIYRPYLTTAKILMGQDYSAKSVFYLFLYNAIFILPAVLTILAVYYGVRSRRLREWRNKKELLTKTKLIHVIIGAAMIFVGIYLIQNRI